MALEVPLGVGAVTIYGAGGHGRVVADIVARSSTGRVIGYLDDRPELFQRSILGHAVLGGWEALASTWRRDSSLIIAIGDNDRRAELVARALAAGYRFATAIDPSAQIGADVMIGPGTVVMPNAVINTGARIGAHVIVNTSASVDHDSRVGDYSHISPGAHLGGGVIVGSRSHVGIGASVIPGVRIGDRTIVGAGAAVIRDVPSDVVAVGNPAAVIKRR